RRTSRRRCWSDTAAGCESDVDMDLLLAPTGACPAPLPAPVECLPGGGHRRGLNRVQRWQHFLAEEAQAALGLVDRQAAVAEDADELAGVRDALDVGDLRQAFFGRAVDLRLGELAENVAGVRRGVLFGQPLVVLVAAHVLEGLRREEAVVAAGA